MSTFIKDPQAVLDYQNDWSSWLDDSDTIATSAWAASVGITIDSESNTDTTATVWLSGGIAGEFYRVTNTITTAGDRTDERTITIRMQQR